MERVIINSDVLIIGGGTAGCYATIYLGEDSPLSVALVDKANISRSGCLAAGVNALNAYITDGHKPEDYIKYASNDAGGIAREDLLLDISERLNAVIHDMEKRGLKILKDENGNYISLGWQNLKINGENIKPILAREVRKQKNVKVYEHVNVTDFRFDDKVRGASGIYRPNNPENLPHQTWYCLFNTGAGFCMGILAGAEMTTFEMRFIALRCQEL